MLMNSPDALKVHITNLDAIEHGRQLSEHVRNIDRLIALNNRRIARGLRPFAFPSALVQVGRDLLARA